MAIRTIKSSIQRANIYLNLILIRTMSAKYCVKGCVTLVKDPKININSEVWGTLAVLNTEAEAIEFMDTLAVSWSRLDISNA
jgi:predicted small integral membrane protein